MPGSVGKAAKILKRAKAVNATAAAKQIWRNLGALKHAHAFSALKNLGDDAKKLVNLFNNSYDELIFFSGKTSMQKFEETAAELEDLIRNSKLPLSQKNACLYDLYVRDLAVRYSRSEAVVPLLEAVKEAGDESIKAFKLIKNELAKLQAMAAGRVAKANSGTLFTESYKKFEQVVDPHNRVLKEAFKYLKENGSKIKAAEGDSSSYTGYINKLKGILFEAYASRSKEWKKKVGELTKEAEKYAEELTKEARAAAKTVREAAKLANKPVPEIPVGKWEVQRITGGMKLYDWETWDEAILLVRKTEKGEEAMLFAAAQFKSERRLSALNQTIRDIDREVDPIAASISMDENSLMPSIINLTNGVKSRQIMLLPNKGGIPSKRFVLHTEGAGVSKTQEMLLASKGILIEKLELDITAKGMAEIAIAFANSVIH